MRTLACSLAVVAAACTSGPTYLHPEGGIEVGSGADGDEGIATATFLLPFDTDELTSMLYQERRARLLESINERVDPDITLEQLPLVQLRQLDVSIEWSIKNLSDQPGTARIHVSGGNQYFYYVPANFIVDDDEDEAVPPPLAGDVPIQVAAQATVSGVFREDQLREAAIDLDLITRGALNPFAAVLNLHEDIRSTADVEYVPYPPDQDAPPAAPPALPIEAFAQLVRLDLTFEADRHMVMEYAVRARDPDELLHEELTAAEPGELHPFMPAEFVPALPAP